jgi:hypothetical protein
MTIAPHCRCGGLQPDRTPENGKEIFVYARPILRPWGAITRRVRVCRRMRVLCDQVQLKASRSARGCRFGTRKPHVAARADGCDRAMPIGQTAPDPTARTPDRRQPSRVWMALGKFHAWLEPPPAGIAGTIHASSATAPWPRGRTTNGLISMLSNRPALASA